MTKEEKKQITERIEHDLSQLENLKDKVIRDFTRWEIIVLELLGQGDEARFVFKADQHTAVYKDVSLFALHVQNAVEDAKSRYSEQPENLEKVVNFEAAFSEDYTVLKKLVLKRVDDGTLLISPAVSISEIFTDDKLIHSMLTAAVSSAGEKLENDLEDIQNTVVSEEV